MDGNQRFINNRNYYLPPIVLSFHLKEAYKVIGCKIELGLCCNFFLMHCSNIEILSNTLVNGDGCKAFFTPEYKKQIVANCRKERELSSH